MLAPPRNVMTDRLAIFLLFRHMLAVNVECRSAHNEVTYGSQTNMNVNSQGKKIRKKQKQKQNWVTFNCCGRQEEGMPCLATSHPIPASHASVAVTEPGASVLFQAEELDHIPDEAPAPHVGGEGLLEDLVHIEKEETLQ